MRPKYRDRAASLSDLAAVVELLRAHELADHGRVTADWNEIVRFVWRDPGFRIQDDGRILERGGAGVFREDDAGVEPFNSWLAFPPQVVTTAASRSSWIGSSRADASAGPARCITWSTATTTRTGRLPSSAASGGCGRRGRCIARSVRDGRPRGCPTVSGSRPWRSIPMSRASTGRTRKPSPTLRLRTRGLRRVARAPVRCRRR